MCGPGRGTVMFTILCGVIIGVLSASLSKALRYQAPDECKWIVVDSDIDDNVALVCKLRTINSELEHTNFSVIQPHHTVRLRLECSDALFFQSSLSAGSFRPLSELRELSIEYCKIGNLSDGAFNGLRELRNLTVRTHNTDWSAMTLELSPNAFGDELKFLQRLDLGENNIWSIPTNVLCPLSSLEVLNLTRNRLRDIGSLGFSNACVLKINFLDLSKNMIENLPAGCLSSLGRLQKLYLQGNGLNNLADRAFEGLGALSLIKLSDNRLVSLPPELFTDTKDIKELYLQNNSISVLAPGLFSELVQLLVLDISRNELTAEWINSATFVGLLRLIVLDLSYNRISKIEAAVFRDLYSLQILHLNDNFIEFIPERTFSSLYNLHTLILSNNRLSSLESFTFDGLFVLTTLSLDNNHISTIHPEALRNCTNLQDLHLNRNELTEVPSVLKQVGTLRTLDLGENHLKSLENATFREMQYLYGLRLTENKIGNISDKVFDKMIALKILNLSKNNIQRIEPGAFDGNSNLQAIRLDGNYLSDIGNLFTKLPSLVWLNISDNQLQWFDYALIPTGLQWLDLHSNQIAELGNYFEIESTLQLTTFDASSNKLTEVMGSAIPNSVQMLYLNNNQIQKVQPYTFFKKPNLTRVELNHNKITRLDPNALRISAVPNDRPLPEFQIGNNPYQCDCTMEWLQKVNTFNRARTQPKIIDLDNIDCILLYNRGRSSTPLKEVQTDQFLCKYETHCFNLCHCCDFDACDCKMTCPVNCTCYHDQLWSANVVDCSASGYVEHLPDQIPMDATQVYLDGNDIKSILSHAFIGRKRLKILFLNASNIDIIHNRTFNGLKELEQLRLDQNRLSELKGYEFDGLESLRILHLDNNRITSISNMTFQKLNLQILTLHNNHLTTYLISSIPLTLNTLTLSGNLWSCECEFFDQFRQSIAKMSKTITDIEEIRCTYPSNDMEFYITHENLTCTSSYEHENNTSKALTKNIIYRQAIQDYLHLVIITLILFLLIILITLLIFIFRQEMRVWFHSKFGIRLFYRKTELELDDSVKLFDAFISYSSKDEAFVAEELAPILERSDPKYKLCLHYRDFPVGAFIADTIVQAVESSSRTIMVLSENFIKSEWCRFEFKSAHHQVLRDRRRRLIVILLGDVPQKDLDPDIRLYLKTNTYLQWGDKLFWEKLRFALPDVPNKRRNIVNMSQRSSFVSNPHNSHSATHSHHIHRHNNRVHSHQSCGNTTTSNPVPQSLQSQQGSNVTNTQRTVALHI